MSLFDDVKAMQAVETATEKELKSKFSLLEAKYKSALSMIQTLCSQVEGLKKDLYGTEVSAREEKQRLERECAETRSAFAAISQELKRTKCQKAAITGNRDFWKHECEAIGMLYKFELEDKEKMKEAMAKMKPATEIKGTPVQGVFDFHVAEPVKIAAAIGK